MSTTNLILSGSNSGSLGIPAKPWTAVHATTYHGDGSQLSGVTGATGATGATGPAGADGADGAQGPAGADGADGAQGPAGADGADGAQGPAGSGSGLTNWTETNGHLIPDTDINGDPAYDLGNANNKVRHLFLSDNSLWVGENHKISIDGGEMKFRKRKTNDLPLALRGKEITDDPGSVTLARLHELADLHNVLPEALFDGDDFDDENNEAALAALQDQINTLGASIPDISNLATKAEIPDISNLATTAQIPDISNLATTAQIPDISNLATTAEVPTNVSELTNDANYARDIDLASVATSGVYNDLSGKPDVSGFATTSAVVDAFGEIEERLSTTQVVVTEDPDSIDWHGTFPKLIMSSSANLTSNRQNHIGVPQTQPFGIVQFDDSQVDAEGNFIDTVAGTTDDADKYSLYITADQDVGLGTKYPDEKLEVDGNVKATSFIGDGSSLTGIVKSSELPSGIDSIIDDSENTLVVSHDSQYDAGDYGLLFKSDRNITDGFAGGSSAPLLGSIGFTHGNFDTSGDIFKASAAIQVWGTGNNNDYHSATNHGARFGLYLKPTDSAHTENSTKVLEISDSHLAPGEWKMRFGEGHNSVAMEAAFYVSGGVYFGGSHHNPARPLLQVEGTVEATSFIGDGSQLTGITGDAAAITAEETRAIAAETANAAAVAELQAKKDVSTHPNTGETFELYGDTVAYLNTWYYPNSYVYGIEQNVAELQGKVAALEDGDLSLGGLSIAETYIHNTTSGTGTSTRYEITTAYQKLSSNHEVTFRAPANGKVKVKFIGMFSGIDSSVGTAAVGEEVYVRIKNGNSYIQDTSLVHWDGNKFMQTDESGNHTQLIEANVAGLTPGQSYTYEFEFKKGSDNTDVNLSFGADFPPTIIRVETLGTLTSFGS